MLLQNITMPVFSDNIRFLRAKLNLTQQKVADQLTITRVRYAKYEDGASEPPIELLIRISKFFRISIDLLVSVDIRKYPLEQMLELPDNRILLPVKVNNSGENMIEIIPQKASMGYLSGYSDPGYIESLQTISLPFLRNGKFRAFPAKGDSMPPFRDGTYIVGKYLETADELRKNRTYIFITENEGITYKRYRKTENGTITVSSDNTFYEPYELPLSSILEIWEFACSISTTEIEAENLSNQNVKEMFQEIRKDIRSLGSKIK